MSSVAATSELTDAELAAWRGFLRVHASVIKQLDAELEAAHGLPLSSYEVLVALRCADGQRLRMADLAERTVLSRSGMTRLVDRLERQGLLKRCSCSDDARGCFACLTPEGEAVLARARPTHLDGVRRGFLASLSEDDLVQLASIWERTLPGATTA